jgi:hypothetical protein
MPDRIYTPSPQQFLDNWKKQQLPWTGRPWFFSLGTILESLTQGGLSSFIIYPHPWNFHPREGFFHKTNKQKTDFWILLRVPDSRGLGCAKDLSF